MYVAVNGILHNYRKRGDGGVIKGLIAHKLSDGRIAEMIVGIIAKA